jgi:hypothetical protein
LPDEAVIDFGDAKEKICTEKKQNEEICARQEGRSSRSRGAQGEACAAQT